MKVIVGSENPVKIKAVQRAFQNYFTDFEIQGNKVESGVHKQPKTAKESYQGAYNRAVKCLELGADFGVGLEGGLETFPFGTTTCGFIVIIDKNKVVGWGTSARMLLPERYVQQLSGGEKELGELVGSDSGEHNIKQKGGMFGLFSKDVVTREEAYYQGVVFALSRFISADFFK